MRLSFVMFVLFSYFPTTVIAESIQPHWLNSAKRSEGESFEDAYARHKRARKFFLGTKKGRADQDTVEDFAQRYSELDFNNPLVPEWENMDVLVEAFKKLRDTRFIENKVENQVFVRRLSWLYPDDGCFDRAAHVRLLLEKWGERRGVAKLFSMGSLRVTTENHPNGFVEWYYHVVPLVKVRGEPYVIDPAIEPSRPLTAYEWAQRQNKNVDMVKFSICNGFSYSLSSRCRLATTNDDRNATNSIHSYLSAEWSRQKALQRDPYEVLGDRPPWIENDSM